MTEFPNFCDIMIIIKLTDVKKTHDCASGATNTLTPSTLKGLRGTLVISLHT